MANINFFLQGVHPTNTTHSEISNLFASSPSNVIFSTAYLRSNAVLAFRSQLLCFSSNTTFYVGIDNGVTSYQGLVELLNLGVNLFTVDTGRSDIIYHPKFYLGQRTDSALIIIGSANFTGAGLARNFEGNIVLSLDLTNSEDLGLLDSFTSSIDELIINHPHNVTQIHNVSDIDNLFLSGKLEDEHVSSTVSRTTSTAAGSSTSGTSSATPRIRTIISPTSFTGSSLTAPSTGSAPAAGTTPTAGTAPPGVLVWRKMDLSQSDAQYVPPGSTTKRTGNLRLSQADFEVSGSLILWQTYFRNNVFGSLAWASISPTKELAVGTFTIEISGLTYGPYDLEISHAPHRVSGQGNVPTVLHWGSAAAALRTRDLRHYDLELYQISATEFYIRFI